MLFSVYHSQRFSLLINCLINFDLEVSQRLGLRFYRSNSLMLCWSPLHAHFSTIKHLLLALLFKKKYAKFSSIIAWKRETFKLQCTIIERSEKDWWKGTVNVILSDSWFIEWHARFTTVPFKSLSDEEYMSYQAFSFWKLIIFSAFLLQEQYKGNCQN